jgi:hypothetical protein
LQLAQRLYRHNLSWIPPLEDNLKRLLGWKPHPFHETADVESFLARRGGTVAGRITAIINHEHNRIHRERRGFFGFFECVDDPTVATALFQGVCNWLGERGMDQLRGPVNPSMNYDCGLLIRGFDLAPTFMMPYNAPYYEALLEEFGFAKAEDLLAYTADISHLAAARAQIDPLLEQVRDRVDVTLRSFNRSHFRGDTELFLRIYNESMLDTWGFVPLTEAEVQEHARSLRHLLVPELVAVAELKGKSIGVVLGLPDYNPTIKKIGGRLFPFGFARLLHAKRRARRMRVICANILPEYHRWGLILLLFDRVGTQAIRMGYDECEYSYIFESNRLARSGLEKGGAKISKVYRIYDLDLSRRLGGPV